MNLEEWLKAIEEFGDRDFSGPVPASRIDSASRELGLPFPEQYREFLSRLGSGSVASEGFIGLGGSQDLDVVFVCKALRSKKRQKKFSSSLIPVRSDGYGNYDAIDTGRSTTGGEFAVVEWRHEGTDADSNRVLAGSYFAWLESMISIIREAAD